ncbi:MAG: L-threonylcarbamoyladenylate synthase [Patescibacteria group bacterium]|nr:L-threonylcarbamoyladenylate synthase [Patescibacteria group bacterium]MDD4304157.1 L-threonylcarbamoyladenylate synthase [Patescibacteria group bacterium]MDD4695188.1 L-threonylcarbamoyladenylate synthase [Patescibacteria group bacterium]
MVIKQIDIKNPDQEIINGAVEMLKSGKIVVYPTDTIYGIGCDILNKKSIQTIQTIKNRKKQKPLSIICSDLKDISRWANVSNMQYKILKKYLPGPYTFILTASSDAPKILQDPKRKAIGIRIPDNRVCLDIVSSLGNPIVTTSVNLAGEINYINPNDIKKDWYGKVDLILDAGELNNEPSTIVSLVDDNIEILRQGKGIFDF